MASSSGRQARSSWSGAWIYASEGLATVILSAVGFGINSIPPWTLPLLERDLTLSYALVSPETVPAVTMILLSIAIPIGITVIAQGLRFIREQGTSRATMCKAVAWQALGLLQAMTMCLVVTNLIKMLVGRPRPNFFALCNYAGYADAVTSGNFTAYNAATVPGAFGSVTKCLAKTSAVYESQRSFVSGHSSISFTGMLFAVFLLRMYLRVPRSVHVTFLALVSASPLLLSLWIAVSRVRDRYHNTDDIGLGAIVGIASAYLAWQHMLAHHRAEAFDVSDEDAASMREGTKSRRASGTAPLTDNYDTGGSVSNVTLTV